MLKKLPPFTKNFYFVAGASFLIWMLFFDSNDFVTQYKLRAKLRGMEREKAYYTEKIEEVKKDREELFSNPELLEKFAREKYLMKKKTEDVYILVPKK
jgi:cell division protein DivIC